MTTMNPRRPLDNAASPEPQLTGNMRCTLSTTNVWATRLFPVRQPRQMQPGEIARLIPSLHFQQAHGGKTGGLE